MTVADDSRPIPHPPSRREGPRRLSIAVDPDDLEAGEADVEDGGALARTDPDRPFERPKRRKHEQMLLARAMNLGAAPDLHDQERRIISFLIEQRDYSWTTGGRRSNGKENMSQRQWAEHLRIPERRLRFAVDELLGLDVVVRWPRKDDEPHRKRGTTPIHVALSDRFVEYLWWWERTWNPRLSARGTRPQRFGSAMVREGRDVHAEMAHIHPDHWMDLPARGRRWPSV